MHSNGTSTLISAGATLRSAADLRTLHTPARTKSWLPVPHHELVSSLVGSLGDRGIEVVSEAYCTLGKGDAKLMGTIDLRIPSLDTKDFRMGLGLRASNDRSIAIQLVAAARVFVCTNWCFSGQGGGVFLKKKHTSGLALCDELPAAVDQYLEKATAFRGDLGRMQGREITDDRAKLMIYDAFAAGVLPVKLFDDVHKLYFDDQDQRDRFRERTLWSLNNAFTEVIKALRPARQHSAGQAIGRLFGRLVHEAERPDRVTIEVPATVTMAPLALPAPAADPDVSYFTDFN